MKGTVFYKMSGSGNDFVALDGRFHSPDQWPPERIRRLCDRREGVGADGLVILEPADSAQVKMHFFNCDGSVAAMCGNAALCSTRLAAYLELAPGDGMELITGAGTFQTRCLGEGWQAELNLPAFDLPKESPDIRPLPGEHAIYVVSVGVPHLVVLVGDLEAVEVIERGRELRHHAALGSAGANVNFVGTALKAPGQCRAWPMRTYERGVEGETLACGTGAVAAAATLVLTGQATGKVVMMTRSGKPLTVRLVPREGRMEDVWLAGEGVLVYRGVL